MTRVVCAIWMQGCIGMEFKVGGRLMGAIISAEMSQHFLHDNPAGISLHLHVTTVGINRIQFQIAWSRHVIPDGRTVKLETPAVAASYAALCAMLEIDAPFATGLRA